MNTEIQYKSFIDLELTRQLLNSKDPAWLPYIGKNYQKASKTILVIGLSHYDIGGN